MKLPRSIRIGGVEYEILRESRMNDGRNLLAGQIRHMECQIAIAEECSHEYKCLSLWHEIMHGIEEQAQVNLGEDRERIIEAFARGVYQVLQDNDSRLFDIVGNDTAGMKPITWGRERCEVGQISNYPLGNENKT